MKILSVGRIITAIRIIAMNLGARPFLSPSLKLLHEIRKYEICVCNTCTFFCFVFYVSLYLTEKTKSGMYYTYTDSVKRLATT